MGQATKETRGPRGGKVAPTRSFRLTDADWAKLRERARAEEGISAAAAVSRLVEAYLAGALEMPKQQIVYPASPSIPETAATDPLLGSQSGARRGGVLGDPRM